jgi:hypothetical protein
MHFLIETNGKISSLNFMQQVGRNHMSIYWTYMRLFTNPGESQEEEKEPEEQLSTYFILEPVSE